MIETLNEKGNGKATIGEIMQGNKGRMHYSMRASKGIITVIKGSCPYCHHHKAISYESPASPFYGVVKCSRCKKEYKR